MEILDLYTIFKEYPSISTDTRSILPESIFFALKGANFNGNAFAAQALEKGAAYAVIDETTYKADNRFLLVDDVLLALQDLARHHRQQLAIPVIGITGTNGKTTTKELLHTVLSAAFRTVATQGNLNNHIGVPLTILSITADVEMTIIEMGANHPGEIALLCSIAQPTHGLITNVGKAHLEGFGGFEGVKRTKAELYDWLAAHDGVLFLQHDNAQLAEMASQRTFERPIITYGFNGDNRIFGNVLEADPFLRIGWQEKGRMPNYVLQTQLAGAYNTENVLAAICTARYFEISPSVINQTIGEYVPKNNRSQLIHTVSNTLICDYYNANASSMAAALDNIAGMRSSKKIVVLGDMFELGDESFEEHRRIVQTVIGMDLSQKILVGKEFFKHKNPLADFYETTNELMDVLQKHPISDALLLLKASRGMAFEKLVPYF